MQPTSSSLPRILVVTPTLGHSRWLDQTVASVAQLGAPTAHLLVAPEADIGRLSDRFRGTRVVPDPGGGMYAAINAGIAAASDWDVFTYINDDDLLCPRFLKGARRVGCKGPRIAYGRVALVDSEGRRVGAIPVSPAPSFNRALYAERLEPVFQHGTAVNRAAMTALGGFDGSLRFCGDSELLARGCISGIPFEYVGGSPVAAFRLRAGQLTKNRAAMVAERDLVDGKLNLLRYSHGFRRVMARLLFRSANFPTYAERIVRHGFISFDTLIDRQT